VGAVQPDLDVIVGIQQLNLNRALVYIEGHMPPGAEIHTHSGECG